MNRAMLWIWLPLFLYLTSCSSEVKDSQTTTPETKPVATIESKEGKKLFFKHCALCHNRNMVDDMTGPALYKVEERWDSKTDLIHFIQDPQSLINNNNERAVKVAALWPSEMTAFPQLDSIAIEKILDFVEEKGAKSN